MGRDREGTGVTLIELLVILGVLVFLVVIVFQSRPTLDPRMSCGTNLSLLGKAMLLYSNDYRDELPRAGGRSSEWTGRVADWQARDRNTAYGLAANGTGGQVSISASLYLLVKYMEVEPRSFVCRGDKNTRKFRLERDCADGSRPALTDVWDFGPDPSQHCSYAYHMLYGMRKLTVYSEPGFAVGADRNPWMDEKKTRSFSRFQPDIKPFKGLAKQACLGNTTVHAGDGQNVMFLDTHVEFEERSYCGLDNDNIYTAWDGADRIRGTPPKLGSRPVGEKDSLLVDDPSGLRR